MGMGRWGSVRLGGSEVRDGRILILVDFHDAVGVYLFISYLQNRWQSFSHPSLQLFCPRFREVRPEHIATW